MGITKEGGAGKYLGLPECFSGSKRELFSYITDKLKARLSGWYAKTLSLGGKEVLLKSVAMALPVYAMSCFRLTKHQCQKITSAMTSFWWNSCEEQKKMHWVSWEKMCRSKTDGGLGFRDIGDFNQALLAKQAWRLLSVPDSLLARIYKSRYYGNREFLNASIGSRPSYAWRSIIHGRELLEKGLMKVIGNGFSTKVWTEKWIFDEAPRRPFNKHILMDLNLTVSNLITPQGSWNQSLLSHLFFPPDIVRIMSCPPDIDSKDNYIWAYNCTGGYSVKSGSWLLSHLKRESVQLSADEQVSRELKAKIWNVKTVPKIKMFIWRALSGALAVSECLQAHGVSSTLVCSVCQNASESISHVLFLCCSARKVWEISNIPMPINGFTESIQYNLEFVLKLMENNGVDSKLRMAIPWLLWGIWKIRNEYLYASTQGDLHSVVNHALEEAEVWNKLMAEPSSSLSHGPRFSPRAESRWFKPAPNIIKCNVHAFWFNEASMSGGSWIARDHRGDVVFHAREVFLPASN